MANLIVRNVDDVVVKGLSRRAQASAAGSAEAEHRETEAAPLKPNAESLAEVLRHSPRSRQGFEFLRKGRHE